MKLAEDEVAAFGCGVLAMGTAYHLRTRADADRIRLRTILYEAVESDKQK